MQLFFVTLNPTPKIQNSKPGTLNPKPNQTLTLL